jgi:hypothetical protein
MNETAMFERQAEWQRSRSRLSWGEKLRLAEVLRDTARAFRKCKDREEPERSPARNALHSDAGGHVPL